MRQTNQRRASSPVATKGESMYQIMADGILWQDPDGTTQWPFREAESLEESLQARGYQTEMLPV